MIEPKKVEPNFFLRWVKKSIILTLSNIIPWLIFDFCLFLINFIKIQELFSPYLYLVSLGVVIVIFAFNIALYSNDKINVLKDKILYKKILEVIISEIIVSYIIMLGITTFIYLNTKKSGVDLFYTNSAEIFYWGLAIFGIKKAIFTYFFMCYYQIADINMTSYYIKKGFKLNPIIEIFMILNPLIFVPFAKYTLLIYIMFPIIINFWFVGFKEIFTENKEKETVEEKEEEINTDIVMN